MWLTLWPTGYLEVFCLISTHLGIFQMFFCCWFLVNFIVIREHILYKLQLGFFFLICWGWFYGSGYCLSWRMFHMYSKRTYCSGWVECSINVSLADNLLSTRCSICLLTFLSTCSINYRERSIEVLNCNCGFVYFSF